MTDALALNVTHWAARALEDYSRRAAGHDLKTACSELLTCLVTASNASRGSILISDAETGRLCLVSAQGLPEKMTLDALESHPRSISQWVLRERRGVVIDGALGSTRFETGTPDDQIQSALSVPLMTASGPIGVVNLTRLAPSADFDAADLLGLEQLIGPASAAIERLQDEQFANESWCQMVAGGAGSRSALVPYGVTEILNYQLGFAHRLSRRVGGDLCDRVTHADGTHTLLFADIAGVGSEAEAAAAFVQGLFVGIASPERSATGMVARINAEYVPRAGVRPPASLWVAQLSSNGQIACCGAGTRPALWVPAHDGDILELGGGGASVGAGLGVAYEEHSIRMLPGDLIVMLSDGFLNSRNTSGLPFAGDVAMEVLGPLRREPLDRIVETLCDEAQRHTGRGTPLDDLTVLGLRFARSSGSRQHDRSSV